MKTFATIAFIGVGVGLIYYVLNRQVSQADVLGTATNTQLVNQVMSNATQYVGNSGFANFVDEYLPDFSGIED